MTAERRPDGSAAAQVSDMEATFQYARTSDDIAIAYGVAGEGSPLLLATAPPLCHVQRDWEVMFSEFCRAFAGAFRFVWFDWHGAGMSDRTASVDFSLPAMLRDVEAVVERAGLDQFAMVGQATAVPIAVSYAAAHPERLTHLVLADGFAEPEDWLSSQWARMAVAISDQDWSLQTETMARVFIGENIPADKEAVQSLAEYIRACVDQATMRELSNAMVQYRVASLLSNVAVTTLVVSTGHGMVAPASASQRLAARIPKATYRTIGPAAGELPPPTIGFVLGHAPVSRPVGRASTFHTVLFTDIVGHTEMMQRLGDARGRDVLREHERLTREVLRQHGGAEVKTMGDGFMASFSSVTSALDCAIALQRAFAAHTESMAEPLHVRVGLNAGEPIEEEGDLFGSTVIMASRIAAKAGAGEILIPEPLRHLLTGKSYVYADRGETMRKGFEDAVRLYEVRWRE